MLSDQVFLDVIETTPLVAIDLIVRNPEGSILLGLRNNKPAQGYWFVPGGRIQKNERLSDAFGRLCRGELALDMDFEDAKLIGVYDHIYEDNFLDVEGIGTHYVTLGYELSLPQGIDVSLDHQHCDQRWWSINELLVSEDVHPNSKAYFQAG